MDSLFQNIVIMNFSGVYLREEFYKSESGIWMDCSSIKGKNCYCSKEAEEKIRGMIEFLPPEGIHFIDSGNYHYTSLFWSDKIKIPFSLVVFDNHTDMQKGRFWDTLSCGSWILRVLEGNPYLEELVLLGVGEKQREALTVKEEKKLLLLGSENLTKPGYLENTYERLKGCPIYISIDKDVLKAEIVQTNWSQGNMEISELKEILKELFTRFEVIGMDICGECDAEAKDSAVEQNDRFNREILDYIKILACKPVASANLSE